MAAHCPENAAGISKSDLISQRDFERLDLPQETDGCIMLNAVSTKKRIQIIALFLVLSLGAFFRLYGLEAQSFWNDELSSWFRSNYDSLYAFH